MKNILITGVSSGIGLSLCNVYLDHGFRVLGSVRNEDVAARLTADFGRNFHPLILDITDHESIENSVEKVRNVIGNEGLSCLINNAGIAMGGPVMHILLENFQRQFDVIFFGQIAVTKAYLLLLGAVKNYVNKPGKIINMSSVSGQIAFPFMSPYCTSKFALEAFSDSLRRELLLYGIDVILIELGPIKTPIWVKSLNLPAEVMNTDYGSRLSKFVQHLSWSAKKGMEVDDLAK